MAELNPVDIHVGKRLRLGRTMQGMSQENIGEAIGVSFQQIQKYERGVNCIRSSKLYELARVLQVPVTFFFDGFGAATATDGYSIPGAADNKAEFGMDHASPREMIELMSAFKRIPSAKKRHVITQLAQTIADENPVIA